jgi:hypothetical protein
MGKRHIWLQTMPQPKLWGNIVEDLAEGLKDSAGSISISAASHLIQIIG